MFHFQSPRPFRELAHKLETLVQGKLWLQALIGLGLGLGMGIFLGPDVGRVDPSQAAIITEWLALPGELFLRLIKMVLIPLLVASIIRGLGATTDIHKLKSIGTKFFVYVMCTSTIAVSIGLFLAHIIKPGTFVASSFAPDHGTQQLSFGENINVAQELPSALVQLIPANPLEAALNGEMLGIVIFSIIIGIAFALRRNEKIAPLLAILDGTLDVCMTIVKWAMWLVPFAVFGLMARMASQVGIVTLLGMSVYVGTVLLGLSMMLLFYLSLVFIFGHMNPFVFLRTVFPVQLLAFSTSSSAAVMPVSIRTAEEQLDIDPEIAEVIIPLGATVNMDGTALYQAVAILFLAQISGIELLPLQMLMIVCTLVLSSIGTPTTPGVGMVIMGSVAANFGIPTEGLVLILGVDRILDMCRTSLNVTGDLTACVILGRHRERRWWHFLKQKSKKH